MEGLDLGRNELHAEISVKVYHMGVKTLDGKAFSVRLKTGLILLVSCRPEQRGNEGIGVAAAQNRQKDCCTTAF
jgi:hypothetical protein